jgi:SP family myo-inositol transporter-like MFS transporter 13
MGQQPGEDDRHSEEADVPDVSLLLEKNVGQPGLFVWLLTFSAGISGLLFGCRCSPYGWGGRFRD